jgi:N-acetylglucosamine kinase-like BadF-type ATPase
MARVVARPDRSSTPALAVGVDVGGTWIRALALAGSRPVARAATRVTRVAGAPAFLADLWRRRRWTAARVPSLVVASRGVWTAGECRRLARAFRGLAARVRVVPDAQAAALGALGGRPGVLILAGTGSIVVGCDGRGRWERAGGFGALLGDEGSGFWLGREWVRATTGPGDFAAIRPLSHARSPVSAVAALAPAVIARARGGDRRARAIVAAGQAHLAACAHHVARRLRLPEPIQVSWAGSVLGEPWFRAGVARALARTGVRARWGPPAEAPVVAAARLAAAHARPAAAARTPRPRSDSRAADRRGGARG